ncbi:zinc transport system permease protein [Anaerospora hongkongensis]|uniref:Zinc transport system permease protein n=1 Tax=Anaerospora hongkongensis TaxID=244830 RepID=A0A4R1PQF4_9FIRM|nr:metal ABC transporter permease [Anaerospora hongkongensis]TCL32702.1 zinc transport system permease protein [Anaerospora hongkongensis]
MLEILEFDFMQRAILAGLLVGLICPTIGVFLLLRKQSLIGDGLGHVAFAGVATGWLLGIYPVISAMVLTVLAAVGIEEMRSRRPAFGDMILAIFLYTGVACAVLFSSMAKINNVSLIGYLFGSIVTVTLQDLQITALLTAGVLLTIKIMFKQLLFVTFDEDVARINGLPVRKINLLLAVLTALTVSIAMRVVGILMVSALMVIPVAASLQISKSFKSTLYNAVIISELSVLSGLVASFYLNFASGGTIVIVASAIFAGAFAYKQFYAERVNKAEITHSHPHS